MKRSKCHSYRSFLLTRSLELPINKGSGNGGVPVNPQAHVAVHIACHVVYHNGKWRPEGARSDGFEGKSIRQDGSDVEDKCSSTKQPSVQYLSDWV